MRVFKIAGLLALFAIAGIAAFVGLLWLDHTRQTILPAPTGPFVVGRSTFFWTDAAHTDPLATPPGTKRELFAWVWYPAKPQPSSQPDDYMPAPWRNARANLTGVLFSQILTRDASRVRTHSFRDADVSPQQPTYPVIFMRAGLAALTTDYTTLAEDLASHGYVVVGFDAPYRTFVVVLPDGTVIARAPQNNADLFSGSEQEQLADKLVQAWTADTGFALDQLEQLNASDPSARFLGRLDMQRVGLFGHSLGGATTLQFCHDDSRCKAGIDLDGAPLGNFPSQGVTQPFMFLLSDHHGEPDTETRPIEARIRSIYDQLPADRRLYVMIPGAGHYLFSDPVKSPLLMGMLHTLGIVRLDGRRQIAITAHYISSFFDVYLKQAPASTLQRQPEYPEVEYIQ